MPAPAGSDASARIESSAPLMKDSSLAVYRDNGCPTWLAQSPQTPDERRRAPEQHFR